jgi:hypothetical protein
MHTGTAVAPRTPKRLGAASRAPRSHRGNAGDAVQHIDRAERGVYASHDGGSGVLIGAITALGPVTIGTGGTIHETVPVRSARVPYDRLDPQTC